MKKYSFFVMLLFASVTVFGQTLAEINEMMGKFQYKKAKEGIDKFLSDPKNAAKGEGWYYKGRVYNSLSKDSTFSSTEALNLKTGAFEAFKKYQQLDAKQVNFVLEQYVSYFDLYNGFFDIGAKEFNNKNFPESFQGFKNALMVEDYVREKGYEYNGFKFTSLDTSLIINTALAANNAKDEETSVSYYKKLTDAGISGENYLYVYQLLAEYYSKKNDEANLSAILNKGRKLYPDNDYWTDVELDRVAKLGDKQALFAKYEEMMNKFPDKYIFPYNMSVELFNELYTSEKKPANAEDLRNKLTETLKKAIALDKGTDANMLMARHIFNVAYDYQDSSNKYRGTKPDLVKKRNDFRALSLKKVDESIPYGEKCVAYYAALSTYKPIQKANYKNILDILSQLYTSKGDLKKAADYTKKKAEVDKL